MFYLHSRDFLTIITTLNLIIITKKSAWAVRRNFCNVLAMITRKFSQCIPVSKNLQKFMKDSFGKRTPFLQITQPHEKNLKVPET